MTFSSAKNKDDDDTGSAQIQYGTSRAYGARIGGYLRVPQTTVLSPDQGTEAARIADRLRLAFQSRRDRTVDDPRTETKLICVPCDRTATDKRQRQEANCSCGPQFNFSLVFERSRH